MSIAGTTQPSSAGSNRTARSPMYGCRSAWKKCGPRRCSSRCAIPVSTEAAVSAPSAATGRPPVTVTVPRSIASVPVTVRMPKLRAENVALVSAGTVQVPSRSSVSVVVVIVSSPCLVGVPTIRRTRAAADRRLC